MDLLTSLPPRYNSDMKYPWVSISILSIWLAAATIIIARADARVEYVLALALFSTVVLVVVGFRSAS